MIPSPLFNDSLSQTFSDKNMTGSGDFLDYGSPGILPPECSFDIERLVENNDFMQEWDSNFTTEMKEIKHEPITRIGPPDRGDFEGPYKFTFSLGNDIADKKKYLYSKSINKVFLCMLTEMPIEFKWNWEELNRSDLWIRATLILASTEQQESRVLRCFNHRQTNDPSNRDVRNDIIPHVLRSARQTEDVVYCGMENDDRLWLSVATPVETKPPRGVNAISHVYKFCCKHSCQSGINRRRIEVLFTLEDSSGEIYGRQSLGIRVCSNPRRDMEKEEEEFKMRSDGGPSRKRRMVNNDSISIVPSDVIDTNLYSMNLRINGLDGYYFVLRTIYNYIAGQFIKLTPDHPLYSAYRDKLSEIDILLNRVPQPCNPK